MPDISVVQSAPDISFIDSRSVDDVRSEMVADYEQFISEATGETVSLSRASPHRMELYSAAVQIYQSMQYIDRAGKQNLLKYSYSDWLDNVVLLKGVTRMAATAASTTLRFTLSAVRTVATGIPAGTRVVSGSIYFETEEYAEIPAGELEADVSAICTTPGVEGNGLAIGALSTIVDPVAYVESVTNITETAGGAAVESDADLAERAYLAPSSYSTAGPEGAYEYWVKAYSAAIGDVKINSDQQAGAIDIFFLMADGTAPGEEMISGLLEYLRTGDMRPMDDLVHVSAPAEVAYTVDLQYWINRSDSNRAMTIQAAVEAAVAQYVTWQRTIGRDINPSRLTQLVMAAGAKRVEVTAPAFTKVGGADVAALASPASINYGGLEDD